MFGLNYLDLNKVNMKLHCLQSKEIKCVKENAMGRVSIIPSCSDKEEFIWPTTLYDRDIIDI